MLKIRKYTADDYKNWQRFAAGCHNTSLFHNLDFLAYHGDRFSANEHHLMWFNGEALYAVMPMAIFDEDEGRVAKSPYGASYGGIITHKRLTYSKAAECAESLIAYLSGQGVTSCRITPPTRCCQADFDETLLFALLEKGFTITNSDISSVVDLSAGDIWQNIHSKSRNMVRKAEKLGVEIRLRDEVDAFWELMDATYARHGVNPTHTKGQWADLQNRFPERIWCDIAYMDDKPVAGVGHFAINDRVDSSFYLARNPEFHDTQGMFLLISEALKASKEAGYRYFDFGTSSVNMQARANIFLFKERFGAHGEFRHTLTRTLHI